MGIFDVNGPANGPAEVELAEHLKTHPMLEIIENIIFDEDNEWIAKRTGYYDSGDRTVHIGTDCFRISAKRRELVFCENGLAECHLQLDNIDPESIFISFSGFAISPLHEYRASCGKIVKESRVVYLWALTVQNFFRSKFPDAEFHIISEAGKGGINAFMYRLPKFEVLDWLVEGQ